MKLPRAFRFLRSRLSVLNFFLVQWLFLRVYEEFELDTVNNRLVHVRFGLLGPVVPLTGWWTNYVPRRPRVLT